MVVVSGGWTGGRGGMYPVSMVFKKAPRKHVPSAPKPYNNRKDLIRTPEMIDEILTRIAMGETLISICADEHMPDRATFWEWRKKDVLLDNEYSRAREYQMESFADQIIEDSRDRSRDKMLIEHFDPRTGKKVREEHRGDNVPVQRDKLISENKRYLMERLNAIYNPRQQLEMSGSVQITPVINYGSDKKQSSS